MNLRRIIDLLIDSMIYVLSALLAGAGIHLAFVGTKPLAAPAGIAIAVGCVTWIWAYWNFMRALRRWRKEKGKP